MRERQNTVDGIRRACLVTGFSLAAGLARPGMAALQPSVQSTGDSGRVIRVGPAGDVTSVAAASQLARDGDVVEVQAGEYRGDVAVWHQGRLSIRAVGGPVRLLADGNSAEGKAIWVFRDGDFDVQGFEFCGARVPDRNGAGIRFERGRLRVRYCRFLSNEMGLLTSNHPEAELDILGCEFSGNGVTKTTFEFERRTPIGHGLYVGRINQLAVSASYFSRGRTGHLLKTRARQSRILYNRLSDEASGRSSYELEMPNGGLAMVIGNLIVQEARTRNPTIVSYGAEGLHWQHNELALVHNTIANRRAGGGTFVRVHTESIGVQMFNNLLVGDGGLIGIPSEQLAANSYASEGMFCSAVSYDFSLPLHSPLRGTAIPMGQGKEGMLMPQAEYLHPMQLRWLEGLVRNPGAFQR